MRLRFYSVALWLGLLGVCLAGPGRANPLVERVSFTQRADGQGMVIRFHTTAAVPAFREPKLSEDGLLELIIFNAALAPHFVQDVPHGPVRHFVARPSKGHLVFQFQLAEGADVDAQAYRDKASQDLILGLTYDAAAPFAATAPVAPPAPPVRRASARSSAAQPAAGTLDAARQRWTLDTIVIDAGHGGKDHGAQAHGVREKDVTLAVAKKLGQYIEEHLGVRVVYTRGDDRFIELKKRGQLANQAGGKLFVSIHANAARSRAAKGTETFFLGLHKSEAAKHVMERENSVVRYEDDPDQYSHYDEQALILQTLAQSAYMRKSEQLAARIEGEFAGRVGRQSRGVKQAGFYVLWSASMPAILVELGFLTNPEEAAFLKSEKGQAYLASAIFRAIRDFKEEYEQDLRVDAEF